LRGTAAIELAASRRTALVVGILLIVGVALGVATPAVLSPILNAHDRLGAARAHPTRMEWGVLLQVLTAIGAIAIPVVMYPMLSIRNVALATAAVVFRVLEAMFYGVSALSSCALLRIGADAVGAGKHEAADAVVAVGNASNFILGVWSFCIAATAYYVVFARYCLVPRWMTTWGLVGVAGGSTGLLACDSRLLRDSGAERRAA